MMAENMLEIDRVSFKYSEEWVLRDISLKVQKGEFWGILGPNGSGKTTLINLIDGIMSPQEGVIRMGEKPVGKMGRKELARRIAVVPQDASLVFPLTVMEVVLMGRTPHLGKFEFESEADLEIARAAMEATGVLPLSGRMMHSLSGGERQRVLIARALAQQPEILLLDEPTSSLDIAHQMRVMDIIRSFSGDAGLTVLAAMHDMNLASLYCDRIALLRSKNFYAQGTPEETLTTKSIAEVYGVNLFVDRHPLTGLPRISPIGGHSPRRGNRWKSGAAPHL